MCPLNTEEYPDSLAIANNSTLTFGTIDEIQKLHITTVPLGESPKRITFQESSQTFGVCTSRYEYKGISGSDTRQQKPSASLIAPSITVSLGSGGGSGVDADSSSVAKKAKDGSSKVGAGSGLSKISHGELIEADSFLIVDQHTFEVTHAHHLRSSEWAMSLMSCHLSNGCSYYCVGTAFVYPEEPEPKTGRILLLEVNEGESSQ
ncbi:DNA damage-binding protein 1-like [Corticium candelabrum]|uniref:DNA damage-binding protein 1-like n=1 Tax=Corticium candelabrum TaxID=121492 RepID=UPI002E2628F8|nr:DNA damage-binding protein 1-like [Corticium candelabrum]